MTPPRVALFTDTFEETNGVATLCREFTAFAAGRQLPFYCVRGGPRTQLTAEGLTTRGSLTTLELRRSPAAFPIDYDLRSDPLLSRYKTRVAPGIFRSAAVAAQLNATVSTNTTVTLTTAGTSTSKSQY